MQKKYLSAIYQKVRHIYEDESAGKFLSLPDTTQSYSPDDIRCLGSLDIGNDEESFEHNADIIFDFSRRMNSPIRGLTARVEDGDMLWEVYDQILNNAILAKGRIDESAKKDYEKALNFLFQDRVIRNPSIEYAAYRTYRDQYFKALEECNRIQFSLSFESGNDVESLSKELEQAKTQLANIQQDWDLHGYRKQVEEALTVFENSLVDNPYSFWQELKKNFNPDLDLTSRPGKGYYANTYIFPTNFIDEKWDTIRIPGEELAKLYESAPDVIKGICEKEESFSTIRDIVLEYRSVRVERPWFNFNVFKSRLWRLPDEMDRKISYGTDGFVGLFPAYVTALLLVRNVYITYIAGQRVSHSKSSKDVSVLAYICKKIPTSPDPDENADWMDGYAAKEKASLNIQQKTGGKVTAFQGSDPVDSGIFEVGQKFRFKATPDEKYVLTQWKVNGQFIDNEDYTYECTLPEGGLTVIPCWELGEPLNSIQARIDKGKLVSIKNGPATLDMNRYADLCRIKVIAENAFKDYDNLCNITLGNFVEIVGENAFSNCRKLERIYIPAATQTIHKDAFARDNYQQDPIIQVHPANETYTTLNGILVEKRKTLAAKTVTCKCGAKYFFAEEAPAVCPACGCALGGFPVQETVVRMPDVKVPFKVTRQEAEERVHQFYAKKGFASKEFKELIAQSEIQLQPVYVPYWEWDVQANGSFTIKVYKQDKANSGQASQDVEKQVETHKQDVSIPETKVSIPASRVVKDVVLSTDNTYTEAFGFDQAPDGTAFELYKKNAKESQGEERQQIIKKLRDQAKQPYSSTLLKSCEDGIINFISETGRLLINPIWIGSFVYKEKPYSFYVDGNNGKVTAKDRFPKNWGKIAMVVGSILAAIALIVLLIAFTHPKSSKTPDGTDPSTSTSTTSSTSSANNSTNNGTNNSDFRTPTSTRRVLLTKNDLVHCDGVYRSPSQINETIGSELNRKDFDIRLDFRSPSDGTVSPNNIITFDSSYRSLGLKIQNKTIHVTVNNQKKDIDTGIPVTPGEWQSVKLAYKDGKVTVNGKEYEVGELNGPGNNTLSSNNFSNGQCFAGDIRNLSVSTGLVQSTPKVEPQNPKVEPQNPKPRIPTVLNQHQKDNSARWTSRKRKNGKSTKRR